MKVFILLALVAAVLGDDGHFYDPSELPCMCSGCSDPMIVTFDSAMLLIKKEQKTRLSSWAPVNAAAVRDICRYSLRVVTQDEIDRVDTGKIYLDWLGFGFDDHKSPLKNKHNIIFGQSLSQIKIRGQGMKQDKPRPLPYTYEGFKVSAQVDLVGDTIEARFTCPFALNFKPAWEESEFMFWVGEKFQDERMTGLCGDCNGDPEDDFRNCLTDEPVPFDTPDKYQIISDLCSDGKHQGQKFSGGDRVL